MLPSAESIQIIIPIVSAILLIMGLKNPLYGVIAYFVIMNTKIGEMYPALGTMRIDLISALIVFAQIFIFGRGFLNILPRKSPINAALWVLFLVGMLSVLFSVNPQVSWNLGGYFLLKVVFLYAMIVLTVNTRSDLTKIFWVFVIVAAWVAYEPVTNYLFGIVQEHGYGDVATGRFGSAAGHVALANILNQSIPITLYLAISSQKKYQKLGAFLICFLLLFGVYASRSRGGFLGLAVLLLGFLYFAKNKFHTAAIVGLVMMFFVTVATPDYFSHMSTILHGVHGSRSSSDRYMGLVNGVSMMVKRPILGVGIGCYAEARSMYFNYYFFSHNLYGELFGELGLASLAWFYWMYVIFRRTGYMKKTLDLNQPGNTYYFNMISAIQLGLILRLFLGNFTHGSLIWFWFVMAAFAVSMENILSQEKNLSTTERMIAQDV